MDRLTPARRQDTSACSGLTDVVLSECSEEGLGNEVTVEGDPLTFSAIGGTNVEPSRLGQSTGETSLPLWTPSADNDPLRRMVGSKST